MFKADANFVAYVYVGIQKIRIGCVNVTLETKCVHFVSLCSFCTFTRFLFDEPMNIVIVNFASVRYRNQPLGEQNNNKNSNRIPAELLVDLLCEST